MPRLISLVALVALGVVAPCGPARARRKAPTVKEHECRAAGAGASQVLCLQAHKELMGKPERRHVLYRVAKGKGGAISVRLQRVDSKRAAALLGRGRRSVLRRLKLRPRGGEAKVKLPGGRIMRVRLAADGTSVSTLSFRGSAGARSHSFFADDIVISSYKGKISSTSRLLGLYLLPGPGLVMLTGDVKFFGKLPKRPPELLQRKFEAYFYDLDGKALETSAD